MALWVSEPDRRVSGYWLATATPMAAVAACISACAARISGRWRTRFDGRLSGTSAGAVNLARSKYGAVHSAGDLPACTDLWWRAAAGVRLQGRVGGSPSGSEPVALVEAARRHRR